MGGYEFKILLPDMGEPESVLVAKRLHEFLATELRGKRWPITVSMGVAMCTAAPTEINKLIKEVGALMYEVKRSGKNRVKHNTMTFDT
jgi:diguanylate cyclase (GGDEF)-like protein